MFFFCSRHASRAVRLASGAASQVTSDLRRAAKDLPFGLLAAALLLVAAGCGGDSKSNPKSTGTSGKAAGANEEAENQCESILTSIDDIFQIQRLGRTTAVSDGVARLNDWRRACAPQPAAAVRQIPAEIRILLSPDQLASLAESNFMPRDGEHVRDCMLAKAISGYAVGSAQGTELEKVTSVFGHVIRAVGLVPRPLYDLPLTPYEVYLLGKGTALDRAWIFVNVLRQLKIDAVLIVPRPAGKDVPAVVDAQPFLVGVLVEGQVYLFDPLTGVPIPALGRKSGAAAVSSVATLGEAASDPAVLQQLDAEGKPYPIRAADLARPGVVIVGDTSLWSQRMEALQAPLVGSRAMMISDPLTDSAEDSAGIWTRVVKAGKGRWEAADVRLWDYPETQLDAHVQMTKDQQDSLEGLLRPFEAFKNAKIDPRTGLPVFLDKDAQLDPAAGKFDPNVRVNVRLTKGEQMHSRLAQLAGEFTEAVKSYTNVRGRCLEVLRFEPPPAIRSIHTRAIDDAYFWTALCQFEQGQFQPAADTLGKYRKRAGPGNWMRESRYLLALSLAAAGDRAAAIKELEAVEPDDPEYTGYRLLIRQWREAGVNPDP
jgi:hypothetical protein